MGQQQLLLLVLGIVIVGIAVVAGIQAFGEGKGKAQQDAAVSDAMRVISDLQAWKLKPTAFGGGDDGAAANASDFSKVSFQALGITPDPTTKSYKTVNGCYALTPSTTGATVTVQKPDCSTTIATVTVSGTTTDAISWSYATGTTTTTTSTTG